jgi:uroporphyrinogen-III decarboxylase
VSVIQEGDEEMICASTRSFFEEAGRRAIVSAGCEITPGTGIENMKIFSAAARELKPGL